MSAYWACSAEAAKAAFFCDLHGRDWIVIRFGTYFSHELEIGNTTSGIWAQNIFPSPTSDENLSTLPVDLPRPLKFGLCSSIFYGIEDLDGGGSESHLYGFRLLNHDRCCAVCGVSGCPIPWGIEPAFFIVEGKEE